MERIEQLLGRARYKMAPDTNFNYKLNLESSLSPLKNNFNKIISILSADQVFQDERDSSTKYRILGRLNIITDNSIYYTATTVTTGANPQTIGITKPNNSDWTPLFGYGNVITNQNPPIPNNWVLQILYPSKIDKYTKVGDNQAYKGITIKNLISIDPSGTKEQVLLETQQKNKLVEGDFCYIYSNTHNSIYTGFHDVDFLGVNGQYSDTKLRLTTKYIGPDNELILKRVINVSDNDINFLNTQNIIKVVATDLSGTSTNSNYTKVTTGNLSPSFSALTHNLRVSDYIDIRTVNGPFILNGLYRVEKIIDRYNFIIDLKISNIPGLNINNLSIPFRRMDGIPSDYYIRKFTVLTGNDYEVNKTTSFGTSIYPKTKINKLSVANDTWLFTFIQDINTKFIYSHKDGELTQLYLGTIKRAGSNNFNWSDVTANWDFEYSYADSSNKTETISLNNPSGIGTIEKNIPKISEYFGDFVEYNRGDILERTVSKIIHRFALNTNNTPEKGYYIDPFSKLDIRKFSNIIESAYVGQNVVGIPGDSELRPNGSLEWRDILEPGYIENGDNGVNYPFLNGANYIYLNKFIYVKRQIPEITIEPLTVNPSATVKC